MKPKISVIIPVYNTKDYLVKCLTSVCQQTYKNLEIICIDDGSTDGSEKIVDEFAANDKRIIAIHKQNGGESSARNEGLRHANGEYIGFLDCDDWIEMPMYEELLNDLLDNGTDMSACGYCLDENGFCRFVKNDLPVEKGIWSQKQLLKYVYRRDAYRGVTGYIWCKLYKTNILKYKNGNWIYFNENLQIGGDILYFSQVALNTKSVIYRNNPYYHYCQRNDSTVHLRDESKMVDWAKAYLLVINNFVQHHVSEEILRWIKRFLVYRAEVLAKLAYENKNTKVLEYGKAIMKKYKTEYFTTNQDFPERLREYEKIMDYRID